MNTVDAVLVRRGSEVVRSAARSLSRNEPGLAAEHLMNAMWVLGVDGRWWPPVWDMDRRDRRGFELEDALAVVLMRYAFVRQMGHG